MQNLIQTQFGIPSATPMISILLKLFRKSSTPRLTPAARAARERAARVAGRYGRKPPSLQDRSLTPEAQQWMQSLPPPARPQELASRFPRICNRIVSIWDDGEAMESCFNSLLVDHRGGRQGFPPQVGSELIRLHVFYVNTRISPHAIRARDDRMLAVGDHALS